MGRPLSPRRKVGGEAIWGFLLRVISKRPYRLSALTGLFFMSTSVLALLFFLIFPKAKFQVHSSKLTTKTVDPFPARLFFLEP